MQLKILLKKEKDNLSDTFQGTKQAWSRHRLQDSALDGDLKPSQLSSQHLQRIPKYKFMGTNLLLRGYDKRKLTFICKG